MTRQNMFEILKSKYNIVKEMNKITNLYNKISIWVCIYSENSHYSIEELFETQILPDWKQRGSYLTCKEIKNDLNITDYFVKESSIDNIIIALEYYENIFYLMYKRFRRDDHYEFPKEYYLMIQNVNILLDHLNYERKIFEREEKLILIPKKPEATAVAEISSKETALAILMYNHHSMKSNITGKRKLLYQISLEFETLLKQPHKNYNDFFEKTNGLLNNLHIRHDNKTKEGNKNPVIEIDDKELENWYDELYQLLLFCVLIHDNLERKNRVADFLKSIKENKCKD